MIITILNKSTLVSDADVKVMTAACAIQLKRDVAPAWGMVPMEVRFSALKPIPGSISMVVFDDADEAGALGYHSDGPDGLPYGKVFTKITMAEGALALTGPNSVASVLSHEVIELFLDPECNRWADGLDGRSYAFEGCDPVEGDSYEVKALNKLVTVSNFVLPPWFDQNPPKGSKFDFLGKLHEPFSMTPGGYMVTRTYGKERNTFARLALAFGDNYPEWKKPGKGHAAARTAKRGSRTQKWATLKK